MSKIFPVCITRLLISYLVKKEFYSYQEHYERYPSLSLKRFFDELHQNIRTNDNGNFHTCTPYGVFDNQAPV